MERFNTPSVDQSVAPRVTNHTRPGFQIPSVAAAQRVERARAQAQEHQERERMQEAVRRSINASVNEQHKVHQVGSGAKNADLLHSDSSLYDAASVETSFDSKDGAAGFLSARNSLNVSSSFPLLHRPAAGLDTSLSTIDASSVASRRALDESEEQYRGAAGASGDMGNVSMDSLMKQNMERENKRLVKANNALHQQVAAMLRCLPPLSLWRRISCAAFVHSGTCLKNAVRFAGVENDRRKGPGRS